MSSININQLVQGKTVDFNSLREVANGRHNKGEVDAKVGKSGISFGKINNHVTYTEKNNVVRGETENTRTNAAVFKAILEHYGRIDDKKVVSQIANSDLKLANPDAASGDKKPVDVFSRLSNPYIKEAFKFLMVGEAKGTPLSRDELKKLLSLLDGWEKSASQTLKRIGQKNFAFATKVAENMNQTLSDSMWMLGLKTTDGDALDKLKELYSVKVHTRAIGQDAQMAFLKNLARYVGGEAGGKGFMGVDEFGSTVNFLANANESFDVNALSKEDKKCLNKATDRLRKQIVDFAQKLGGDLKEAVLSKLPSESVKKGLKDFIPRGTVAEIINLVAGGLTDSKGNKFDWKGIKPAATLSSTTLEKVFDFDYRHNLEKLRNGDTKSLKIENGDRLGGATDRKKVFSGQMLHCLEDADIQKKLADEDLNITEGRDVDAPPRRMTSFKFDYAMGSTSKALATLLNKYPGKKISAMGYGDNTYCACYWKTEKTQEEAMFRMLDPKTVARFKAHGKVEQTTHSNGQTQDVLKYVGNVRSRYSPAMGGIHVDTSLVAVDEKPLAEAQPVGVVIGAAPSLTSIFTNRDIIGNLDHMVMCRKDILRDQKTIQIWDNLNPVNKETYPKDYEAAEKMQSNGLAFCEKFWAAAQKNKELFPNGVEEEEFRSVMQMELYLKFDDVDVYADDTDVQVEKLLAHLVERKKDPVSWIKTKVDAHENYAKCMLGMFRNMIRMENAKGTEVLLVGKMGCGAFNNLSEDMLSYLAEACVLEGGDMKIVYSAYNEDSLPDKDLFKQKLEYFAKKHGVIK